MRIKIDLYRRLSRSIGDEAIGQMRKEFVDRFGPLPPEVERLLTLARLKTEAAFWQIETVRLERPYMVFEYADAGRAKQLAQHDGRTLRIVDDRCIYLTLPEGDLDPRSNHPARHRRSSTQREEAGKEAGGQGLDLQLKV